MPDGIAERTKRGLLWRFASQGAAGTVSLATNIVLARLLMPKDFGIVALAFVVIGFIELFRTVGLAQALVQRQEIDDRHKAAAFWAMCGTGLGLAMVLIGLAKPAAQFFGEAAVRGVMYLLSVNLVLAGAAAVPTALLQRRMDFKRLLWPDLVGWVVYGAVAIPMALRGFAYWSLAWGSVARALASLVLVVALAGYVPRLSCRAGAIRDLLGFGVPVQGVYILNWCARNVDYLVVGKYLPAAALGIYKKAYEWTCYTPRQVLHPLCQVLFPALSRLQTSAARTRYAFSRAQTGVSMVGLPAIALLAVSAQELIPAVFGEQWTQAVLPTQILCITGVLRTLLIPAGALVKARGYVVGEVWCQGLYFACLLCGTLYAVRWGVVAVAWSVSMATAVLFVSMLHLTALAASWSARDWLAALRLPLGATTLLGALSTMMRLWLLGAGVHPWVTLAGTVATGSGIYLVVVFAGPYPEGRRILGDLWASLRGSGGERSATELAGVP